MMSKFVYAAVALAGVVLAKDYSDDYSDYNDDSDSSSSSSSEVAVALPVYLPPGDYYVCNEGGFASSKRCLTFKPTPPPKEDSSSSSSCGKDSSSSADPYVEGDKYRYVYGSKKYASIFTLSYPNATTDAFLLSCKSCENEFHGAVVSMVRHHLEFVQKGSAYVQEAAEFQAYAVEGKAAAYNVRTTEKVHLIRNWWQLSTFRKRVEIGMKPRAMKVLFYKALKSDKFVPSESTPVEGLPLAA